MQQPPNGSGQGYPNQYQGQYPQQQQYQNQYPPQQQYNPQQFYQQVPQPKKKGGFPKWLIGVLAGAVALCAICGIIGVAMRGNTASATVSNGTTASTQPASVSSSDSGNVVAKVGQTITANQVGCTLTKVQVLQADDYTKPKPGQQFIVVHVKLVNNSNDEQDYNPFDFHVKSGAGNITNEEFITTGSYTANNELQAGKLAGGGQVEGDMIFQVPMGDTKAQLTWKPSLFGTSTQYAWMLGLK